jgi:hypothetical protein
MTCWKRFEEIINCIAGLQVVDVGRDRMTPQSRCKERVEMRFSLRSRHGETMFRVAQHKLHLFTRHAGEPLGEIIDSRTVFEVLEKRLDRQTHAFEQPFAGDAACRQGRRTDRTLTVISRRTTSEQRGGTQ